MAFEYTAVVNTSKEAYRGLELFFATAICLVSLKRPNTLR